LVVAHGHSRTFFLALFLDLKKFYAFR
jgi:hypothetical protein